MQYRYLLGGDLLIDMAEQRSVKVIPLDRLLEELTEALKTGKKEQVESAFQEMKDSICQALVEKSRACMYLQQIVRTIDRVCEDVSVDMKRILLSLIHILKKNSALWLLTQRLWQCPEVVSYTHLDVYKRQGKHSFDKKSCRRSPRP